MIQFLAYTCFTIGLIFVGLGVLGLFKFPDPYTRMHALGMADSLGVGFIGLGLFLLSTGWAVRLKLIVALLLFWAINTTMTHLVAKSAVLRGIKPDKKTRLQGRD